MRDFNYVDDVVDAFVLAATDERADGQVFNLGSDEVVSLKQLGGLLAELHAGGKFDIRVFPAERKKIDIGDYYSDFTKIHATLGWQPKVSLRDGLARTLAYFKQHLDAYL